MLLNPPELGMELMIREPVEVAIHTTENHITFFAGPTSQTKPIYKHVYIDMFWQAGAWNDEISHHSY
jgi:hypothetical protein